jgi:hypothetical protein
LCGAFTHAGGETVVFSPLNGQASNRN